MRRAAARFVQPDRAAVAGKHPDCAIAVRGVLLEPFLEVLDAAQRKPALGRAAQDGALIPGPVELDSAEALAQPRRVQWTGDAPWHHVRRMRPLTSEADHDLQDPIGMLNGLTRDPSAERRGEQLTHLLIEGMVGVRGVT